MVVVYHGFMPLDMYFFQEYCLREVRTDVVTMVADFVFKVPFLGWMVRPSTSHSDN